MIQNCIALFCTENLAGMKTTETVAQQSALAGVWDADLTAYANNAQYKNSKMYCELKADGTGVTYLIRTEPEIMQKMHLRSLRMTTMETKLQTAVYTFPQAVMRSQLQVNIQLQRRVTVPFLRLTHLTDNQSVISNVTQRLQLSVKRQHCM